jgi:glutamate--cysteine ligase
VRERRNVAPLTIGAELELIPIFTESLLPVPIQSPSKACSVDVLREAAIRNRWCELSVDQDPPSWELASGARISFEPGGQIEISSSAHASARELIAELKTVCAVIADHFEQNGAFMLTNGVDPYNSIERVPLQLHRDRYERMTRYFDSIGPSGIRMMRQTSSVQINIEPGADPLARWSLLNRMAPILVAVFANSRKYAGSDTNYASYRSHLWRSLDESRTGLSISNNPVDDYCDFALDAGWMFAEPRDGKYDSFRTAVDHGATAEEWSQHLSTLFPEVRPKNYFEVRSPDMVDVRCIPAPIAFVAGVCYDDSASAAALELLKDVSTETLVTAGERGMHEASIAGLARDLADIAFTGCKSLGDEYIGTDDLDIFAEFIDRYPANGRSPADD